jgi:hypothetical protein
MRIRIVQKPPVAHVDGIRLDYFVPGQEYDLGPSLCSLLLAEGWAEPVVLEEPSATPRDNDRPAETTVMPANLVREIFPPYYEGPSAFAADRRHKRRVRRRAR